MILGLRSPRYSEKRKMAKKRYTSVGIFPMVFGVKEPPSFRTQKIPPKRYTSIGIFPMIFGSRSPVIQKTEDSQEKVYLYRYFSDDFWVDPFRAQNLLPILTSSKFVPKKGFQ